MEAIASTRRRDRVAGRLDRDLRNAGKLLCTAPHRLVESRDGTSISYARSGTGPALLVVPGNNRMARHYERLVGGLTDKLTVSVLDRRGRGASGPQGRDYSIVREVEDLEAVGSADGARLVFGHSYGGLVAIEAARTSRTFEKIAVYEPTISLREVLRADSDGAGYRTVAAETLLLHGTKSPDYLTGVLEPLSHLIPNAQIDELPGADHNAPDESAPLRIAARLRAFLTAQPSPA